VDTSYSPELLESPLHAVVERFRLQPEYTKIDELTKHPTEGRICGGHISSFGTVDRSYRDFPRFYIRAMLLNQQNLVFPLVMQ